MPYGTILVSDRGHYAQNDFPVPYNFLSRAIALDLPIIEKVEMERKTAEFGVKFGNSTPLHSSLH